MVNRIASRFASTWDNLLLILWRFNVSDDRLANDSITVSITVQAEIDPDWKAKIDMAKGVRADRQRTRAGRPVLFKTGLF